MPKQLTITVSDDAYASLQSAAGAAHRTPEDLAAEAVLERLDALAHSERRQATSVQAREAVLSVMRSRHHLVERAPVAANAHVLPPVGSPERVRLDADIASELGAALRQSGRSVLDLIERR